MTAHGGSMNRNARLSTWIFQSALPLLLLWMVSGVALAGTWAPLANSAPGPVGHMHLLSNGTVMVELNNDGGTYGPTWYLLTPDSAGHYTNGTWTTLASMTNTRLFFASQLLRDGRLFVAGGEYGTGGAAGEVYDPQANTWTALPAPGHTFSDANSEILPDGRVLIALVEGTLKNTLIYDPVANTWSTGPSCNGIQNESCWVKLPDSSILMVDRLSTNAERYIPSSNTWNTDATVPVSLYDTFGDETGPGTLLPNGNVIYFGSTGHTAIYTPSGSTAPGTWVAGPDIPNGQGCPDAPCAQMPNGKVLLATAPIPVSGNVFQSPTSFYEYDYTTNTFTQVNAPGGGLTESGSSYQRDMLVLPDGTVLSSRFGTRLYVYTPSGSPLASAKPAITSVTLNGDGSYHLTGTQLNGINEGACYGDDDQNFSNYPIVKLTAGSSVYYARTYNWSSTGVATGATPVTTEFTVPASVPNGAYSLSVIANGVASDPVGFAVGTPPTITGFTPAGGSAGTVVTITGTNFTGATSVNFNSTGATFTVNSATQITATAPAGVTTGPIKVTTSGGNVTSTANFTVFSFSPAYGPAGTSVTLTGSGFTGATAVNFNGTGAVFTVDSDTQITTTVPVGASSGAINVTASSGTFTSGGSFTVLSGNGAPTIVSFTPASAAVGAGVTITGTNFVNVTGVSFNGIAATFTVNSPIQITATVPVPSGSVTGFITVTTGYGTVASATTFTTLATLATFNSASDVPVTAGTFTATGTTVYFTLNFAPPTGTSLTVVNNTGAPFIGGTFSNLAQGQSVALTFNGVTYHFVANYFGGTGNDLVLQWANTRPLAWGLGASGQLGGGSTTTSLVPSAVTASGVLSAKTLTALAAGQNHTLALAADGTVFSWGLGASGQLGNGGFANSSVPVAVTMSGALSGKTVAAVAAGTFHGLALCSDGSVAAWGANNHGQLGNGMNFASGVPVTVTANGTLSGKKVIAIAAGAFHSLALCSDGTLVAWGNNANGQLGNGANTDSNVPVTVNITGTPLAGKTITAIAAGYSHSLAACSDGTLASWGLNGNAQLGNGGYADSNAPAAVTTGGTPLAGKTVSALAAGAYFSLALCSDGTLASWGNNGSGQLGDGTNVTQRTVPTTVVIAGTPLAGKTVSAIAAGGYHVIALCADGTLASWGYNGGGEIGNGTTADTNLPVAVSTLPLAAGERFVVAGSGQSAFHSLGVVATPLSPGASTLPATSVTTNSATLNGTANPEGFASTAQFQFGTTTSYGTSTSAQSIGSGTNAVNISANISGLAAHTTYHFVAIGTNAAGTGNGGDLTFTTLDTPPVASPDTVNNVSGPVTIAVLANDSDADGDTLTITGVTQGLSGSVTTNGTIATYTPGASFTTSDAFTYTISDGFGGTAVGNVTVFAAPILAWRAQKFGADASNVAISADTGDPNGNGIPNLLEYALNGDPVGDTTGESILPQATISTGGTLQLAFTRWLDRTDITINVQSAGSPGGPWLSIASSTAGGAFVTLVSGATVNETGTGNSRSVAVGDLYQVTDPAHPLRFMRMQVTRP